MPHIVVQVKTEPAALAKLRAIPDVCITEIKSLELMAAPQPFPDDVAADADVLICTLPPTNLADMPKLRFIQISSVGYAQLYGKGLVERGIRAANARGVFDTAIAEWNVAMMINLARDLRQMIRNQEASRWDNSGKAFQYEIRGSTVGIWGYGGIGRETARLAKALGLTVHVLTRSPVGPRGDDVYSLAGTGDPDGTLPDRKFTAGQELEFLAGLDFLILAMPITPASRGLVGERELRAMKPTAFLLNPARGPLVQEEALLQALRERWIAGAALDTHFKYPLPPEHPLWQMPHVILTPHISGSDKGPHFLPRFWEIAVHNVTNFLTGRPLWNELTPAQLNEG
ncbi:MAG: D-2-hydroxyacid dehydrogenase [Planctomycetaceae bacterium]|nr:D-2-hydroxyacid dehydrogenase [Planctomycetaceae bacterium]